MGNYIICIVAYWKIIHGNKKRLMYIKDAKKEPCGTSTIELFRVVLSFDLLSPVVSCRVVQKSFGTARHDTT